MTEELRHIYNGTFNNVQPEFIWKPPTESGRPRWKRSTGRNVSWQEYRDHLDEICDTLNFLEEDKARLVTELQESRESLSSLRQELQHFSTFEQICNSGMLRNFKIDSESDFAQTILKLLQQTMELQISLLTPGISQPRKEVPNESD